MKTLYEDHRPEMHSVFLFKNRPDSMCHALKNISQKV